MTLDEFKTKVGVSSSVESSASEDVKQAFRALPHRPEDTPVARFIHHPFLETGAALSRIPFHEAILPLLAGLVAERMPASIGRLPGQAMYGAAAGGALSGAIDEARQARDQALPELQSGAGGRIAARAALSAPFGLIPSRSAEDIQFAKDIPAATRLQKEIDVTGGGAKATPRLRFLQNIASDITESQRESGRDVGRMIDQLNATHPERAQVLQQQMQEAAPKIRELFKENPGLRGALLKSSNRESVLKVFPELGFSERISDQESLDKLQLYQQMQAAEGVAPDVTIDDVQRVKKSLGEIAYGKNILPGDKISRTRLDAMDAYNYLRSAELQTHPELRSEFLRHHAMSTNFREVKPYLSDLKSLQKELGKGFAGDTPAQVGVKELLSESPETLKRMRHYQTAATLQNAKRTVIWRLGRYAMFLPLYRVISMMQRDLTRKR